MIEAVLSDGIVIYHHATFESVEDLIAANNLIKDPIKWISPQINYCDYCWSPYMANETHQSDTIKGYYCSDDCREDAEYDYERNYE